MTPGGRVRHTLDSVSRQARIKPAIAAAPARDVRARQTAVALNRTVDAGDRNRSSASERGGAANWLWVAPDSLCACALVVGAMSPAYDRGLAIRFDRVEQVPIASLHNESASVGAASRDASKLPYDDGSVDCVVSLDLVNRWSRSTQPPFDDPSFVAALAELRRVLRPGGVLFLGGHNAPWYRAWLPGAAKAWTDLGHPPRTRPFLRVAAARGALTRAGFSEIRTYFVEPTIVDPQAIVPATRHAALAYERHRLKGRTAPLRSLWAAGGLYRFLYPDVFVLAIK